MAARRAAIFRCEGRGRDSELLESVHRNEPIESAESRGGRQRTGAALSQKAPGTDSGVGADSVDHEIVGIGPLAIDCELPLGIRAVAARTGINGSYTRHEIEEALKAPSVQRHVL